MTGLFQKIAEIQPQLPGWCSAEKAATLASLVLGYRPNVTLEIGIYGGSSFIPMALAHQAIGKGLLVGIEPWDKIAAMQGQTTPADREWWSSTADLEATERQFRTRLHELGLENVTHIIRKKSNDAEIPRGIGIAHIDGSHNDQAVTDVVRVSTNVVLGGFVVMDDIQWAGGGVTRAVARLLAMGYVQLYQLGSGAVFQRMK